MSPTQNGDPVDEEDLDVPSDVVIEKQLQSLVDGVKVFTHELQRKPSKSSVSICSFSLHWHFVCICNYFYK